MKHGRLPAWCRALFVTSLGLAAAFGPQPATAGLRAPTDTPRVPAAAALPPLQVERSISLSKGETLAGALRAAGFNAEAIATLVKSSPAAAQPVALPTELSLSYTEDQPYSVENAELTYRPKPTQELTLTLASGKAHAQMADKPLKNLHAVAVGHIEHSLYQDATEAGLPAALVNNFMNIFAWDIDYSRDIHPGDTFKVMFEETQDDKGRRVKTGRILAAEFTVGNQTRHAYFYNGEYLNEKGESKKKLLLRTPLDYTRISSGFTLHRLHPVLGFTRAHKGTDFAAPMGTAVKASGDGTVVFLGRHGGHGNYLQIKHNGTFTTGYAHLSRYARGLRVGSHVKQGQVVAYVGMTGLATGPHLHYEVIKNGTFVDAMRTDLPTTTPLSRSQLAAFQSVVTEAKTAWNTAFGRTVASR